MILKSMGVDVNKTDMDNYAADVDEEAAGKFNFTMFCQVAAKFMIEDDEEQMKEELRKRSGSTTRRGRASSQMTSSRRFCVRSTPP